MTKVVSAIAFVVAVGFGVQAPAIPVLAGDLGMAGTAVGSVISAFALMRLVSGPVGGRLVDRFGNRAVLVTGMGVVAVTSVLAGLSRSYPELLIARGAGGIGSAFFTVSALSLLLLHSPPERRGRAVGYFQGAFSLGTIAGPALGGLLTGASPRLPFFVYGAAMALAGLIGMIFLRGATGSARGAKRERARLGPALRNRSFHAALIANFGLGWAVFGVRVSILPLFLLQVVHGNAFWTGAGLTACALAQAATLPLAGKLADTWRSTACLTLGCLLVAGSLLVALVTASVPGYLCGLVLMGLGAAFVVTSGGQIVGAIGGGGTVVSVYQMGADLGMVLGPLVAGALADAYGYPAALILTALIPVFGIGLAVRSWAGRE
ncbi:MFS transporter [Nonomuraea sp. NPDC046570]|uniref:MFS transporter n=1 Tax=Nonomuraea sp. NPDC046570 TaxID=3155255 RepID=UPI0033CB4B8C